MSLGVHMCPTEALAVQWACILALTSCYFLYANSSFVCRQAHWQLHVGWGKAPVRIIHAASAAKQTTSQQMGYTGICGLCVSEALILKYNLHTQHWHMAHGAEVFTEGRSDYLRANVLGSFLLTPVWGVSAVLIFISDIQL